MVAEFTKNTYPTLWVSEIIAAQCLRECFKIGIAKEDIARGHHIIALEDELSIRKLAQKFREVEGANLQIYHLERSLDHFLAGIGINAAPMILEGALDYSAWLESLKQKPLSLEEAVAIAEHTLKTEPAELQLNLALEELRQRVNLERRREISSWDWDKKYLQPLRKKLEKIIPLPSIQELTAPEVNTLITEIIQQGLGGAELSSALNELSHRTPWRIDQLSKVHQQKLEEIEQIELRDNTREQLESLLSASNASLDLHQFLHPNLAKALLDLSSRLNLKPEVYLTTLLTVASSLHNPQTRIWLSKEDDFDQPAGLYGGIVAETSQKKSPILKAIATKPLKVLQAEEKHLFEQKLKAYHYALEEWESLPKEQKREVDPPVKPERAVFYFTKTTGEGLEYQAARQPQQGMLYLSDELPAIINNQNKYTNGKGSDRQDFLSYYDSTANTTLRADGIKSELDTILLAILGGVQPQVLQALLNNCEDNDGNWARFIFVNQPSVAGRLHADGGRVDLTGLLVDLYRKIRALPSVEYTLSPEAFKVFQQAYNRYEQNRVNDPLVGMKSVWGKSEGRVGRLALNLHVINSLANGETPSEEIEADTLRRAIALTDYYAMQVKAMYTEFSDSDALAPHLAKVIEMSLKRIPSKSQGWLKASDVYLSITKAKRPTGEKVRLWFSELVTLGKGEVKGVGRSLLFRAFSPDTPPLVKLDKLDTQLDILSKPEPTLYQVVQEKLDKLDKLDDFQKNAMDVEAIGVGADLTTEGENYSLLEELSNLSNFAQSVESEQDAALDNLSNELSNLDDSSPASDPQQQNEGGAVSDAIAVTPAFTDSQKAEFHAEASDLANSSIAEMRSLLLACKTLLACETVIELSAITQISSLTSCSSPAGEQWEVGQQVFIESDVPTLQPFNEQRGVIRQVTEASGHCLVSFGEHELMHIPFRFLRCIE